MHHIEMIVPTGMGIIRRTVLTAAAILAFGLVLL